MRPKKKKKASTAGSRPPKKGNGATTTPTRKFAARPPPSASSRQTRSQMTPNWALHEMLTLASEVAAVNDDCLRSLSSYQKWKIVSDNCAAMDILRSSDQCRRKWEQLLADYATIRDWEANPGAAAASYWSVNDAERERLGLPLGFYREVFETFGAVVRAEEGRLKEEAGGEPGSPAPLLEEVEADDVVPTTPIRGNKRKSSSVKVRRNPERGSSSVKVRKNPEKKSSIVKLCRNPEKEQKLAGELQNYVESVRSILGDKANEGSHCPNGEEAGDSPRTAESQDQLAKKGDDLIKIMGTIADAIDQLVELVGRGRTH